MEQRALFGFGRLGLTFLLANIGCIDTKATFKHHAIAEKKVYRHYLTGDEQPCLLRRLAFVRSGADRPPGHAVP